MIDRGTRSHETCLHAEVRFGTQACKVLNWLSNRKKEYFLIVNYGENFEHFNMMKTGEDGKGQVPALVTIFNTRLQKLELLFSQDQSLRSAYQANVIARGEAPKQSDQSENEIASQKALAMTSKAEDVRRIIKDLRADIAKIPLESFSVKKIFQEVRDAWQDDFWRYLTADKLEFLRLKVAPLLRFVSNVNPAEAFFVSKLERCGLALMQRKELSAQIETIKADVSLLPMNLAEVAAKRRYVDSVLSKEFWEKVTLQSIDEVKEALAPLMRYQLPRPSLLIELGLDDIIESRKWVVLRKDSQRVYIEEYRKRVEEKILRIANEHPTVQKLKHGEEVNLEDLIRLEETLEGELSTDEISLDEENMLKAFGLRVGNFVDFLKHVLEIEALPTYETIVKKSFDAFILEHNYNADQSRFLRVVQSVFLQRKKLELADLYEEPFTSFGMNAVDKLFSEPEVGELIALVKRLAA